jgi:hypothetical protein
VGRPVGGYVLVVNRRLRDPRHLHRAPLILTLIAFVLPLGLDSFAVSAAVSAAGGVSGRAAVVGQGGPGCQLLVQLRGAADDHCVHSQRHGGKLVWMFATLLSARSSH